MRITKQQLIEAIPGCAKVPIDKYLPLIQAAMDEFEIDTRLRVAAFLAQIAHETLAFQFLREIWGPTEAQKGYEGRLDLGNTTAGDGKRFKGRGAIQLTGRRNYKIYGEMLGLPLEMNPDLAATPEVAFRIAGAFWKDHDLNELADQSRFELITRRINGGLNGIVERRKYYDELLRVLA